MASRKKTRVKDVIRSDTKKGGSADDSTAPKEINYSAPENAEIRRSVVFDLTAQGLTEARTANALGVGIATVKRDKKFMKEERIKRAQEARDSYIKDDHWQMRLDELNLYRKKLFENMSQSAANTPSFIRELRDINNEMDRIAKMLGVDIDTEDTTEKIEVHIVDDRTDQEEE